MRISKEYAAYKPAFLTVACTLSDCSEGIISDQHFAGAQSYDSPIKICLRFLMFNVTDLRHQNNFSKLPAFLHHFISFDALAQRHDLVDDRLDFAGPQ